MNQPPNQPDPYSSEPTAPTPNNMPPTASPLQQPGATPYLSGYNQSGHYSPPTGHQPQAFSAGLPPQAGQQQRKKTGWIIGGVSAVVVVVILIIVIAVNTHGFNFDPPSGWLVQTSNPQSIDFIQWTNQNGQLNGSWDTTDSNGLSRSYIIDGSYNYQNHTITLNIHYPFLGLYSTDYGTIQGNTMTLHGLNLSGTNFVLTFHSASQQDYDNTKQHLINPSN